MSETKTIEELQQLFVDAAARFGIHSSDKGRLYQQMITCKMELEAAMEAKNETKDS